MVDPRRKPTVRLPGHDYAVAGAYFVTICVEGRRCLFGEIAGDELILSVAGAAVESWWCDIARRFPSVGLGGYVVMPNHLHGIVILGAIPEPERRTAGQGDHVGSPLQAVLQPANLVGEAQRGLPASDRQGPMEERPSLADIIGWFKTMTTNDYIRGVKALGLPRFDKRLWQRSFYDHVVRTPRELERIEAYIADNPRRWGEDDLNPAR